MNIPDPAPVIDLIEAFRRSKTMFAAVALGVFESLERGPAGISALATELGAQPQSIERLLDACVGLGLLRKSQGQYSNDPVAATYLCRSGGRSLTGYVEYSNNVLFPMWAHLEDAVREGSNRWKQTFALEGPVFDHLLKTEEATRAFLMGMHGFGVLSSPKVVAAFDLSRFRKLTDLGGATGHLAIAACERYADLRAAVFDLPRVIEVTRELVSQSPAAARIEMVAGDFFADDLPESDLFAAGRILHDWSAEKIRALLAKIFARLPAGGGLLIAEKLLAEDKSGPNSTHMQSLNMLVCTEGTERTLAEYRALLETAGFGRVQGRVTGAPLDAIFATKE